MGRPKIELDWDTVEKLASIQCTVAEIATVMSVSESYLNHNTRFMQIHKKGLDEGRMSLRRLQWGKAKEGNTTMLIWLGKQYLGQSDKQELTGADGAITIKVIYDNQVAVNKPPTAQR